MLPARNEHAFPTTRWSRITRTDARQSFDATRALSELCLNYWYPVYAYVRHSGHPPAIAEQIACSFQHALIQQSHEGIRPSPHEHFRTFLLARLRTFLASDWHDLIDEPRGTACRAPRDLERRDRCDNYESDTPEQAYHRCFAIEVLTHAFVRLQLEAAQTGNLDMFRALEPFLANEPRSYEYERIARQLHNFPLTIVVALKRLRERFQELAGAEVADTVGSHDDMTREQQELRNLLW